MFDDEIKRIENDSKNFISQLDSIKKDTIEIINEKEDEQITKDNNNLKDAIQHNIINDDYYTEKELQTLQSIESYNKWYHIVTMSIGFILMLLLGVPGMFILFIEIILNIVCPYIYIIVKLLLHKKQITTYLFRN